MLVAEQPAINLKADLVGVAQLDRVVRLQLPGRQLGRERDNTVLDDPRTDGDDGGIRLDRAVRSLDRDTWSVPGDLPDRRAQLDRDALRVPRDQRAIALGDR